MDREEAIRRIKAWNLDSDDMEVLAVVIPELAESEDERIRNSLLEFLDDVWHMGKNANFDRWGKADCADWIAYLEKQKEPQHAIRITKGFGDPDGPQFELVDLPEEQKPVEYLNKDKVYDIMTKLTNLSYSTRIPIDSDEYKKIDEITSDVRKLLDYPIEQKQ